MATEAPPVPAGPAHVAVVSFLAARAAPTGGFWIALAGGVALARLSERRGARLGFGASAAAMLETVAIIGPARFGIPLTQAATAPLLGRLVARRVGVALQVLACGAIRLLHNTATTAFFIWIVAGGLDAYAGTYESLGRRLGLDIATTDALALTAAGLLVWAVFASVVQVLVYRRGLRDWDGTARDSSRQPAAFAEAPGGEAAAGASPAAPTDGTAAARADAAAAPRADARPGRFDPRAVTLAAAVAFALLLASTEWLLLGAVSVWLGVAWALSRGDRSPVPTGLLFAAILAAGAFIFTLGGGLGLDTALRRAARAALLVLVATWLRAAAGAEGLRQVSRRALGRLRRLPAAPEAAAVLDGIASEGRLAAAARSLAAELGKVRMRPLPVLDAVLTWVVREAGAFRPSPPRAPAAALAAAPVDCLLVLLAAAPAVALGAA
ncbi:MAG: hypothetical protein ICV69_13340 [Thermoleophilaceae bacterium]|nr:hypothetical protein [Thermoleophilaceae bacterium]